jgi:hypothetical protein
MGMANGLKNVVVVTLFLLLKQQQLNGVHTVRLCPPHPFKKGGIGAFTAPSNDQLHFRLSRATKDTMEKVRY